MKNEISKYTGQSIFYVLIYIVHADLISKTEMTFLSLYHLQWF